MYQDSPTNFCLLAQSCPALCFAWTAAHQTPLSMEFSRQDYWSGLPFPSPGDLLDLTLGSKLGLLHCRQILYQLSYQGRGTRDQIASIHWIIKKAREFQKNIYFCFIDYAKVFDYVDHDKLWKILKETGIPDHLTCLREISMQVKKQQLELDMEQETGSKLGKEYVKAIYCFPAYLTYMQSTS